jgi:hypothetical protein
MIGGIRLINELAHTGSSIEPMLDSEASADASHNILSLGGPMANLVTADLNDDMGISLSSDATKYTISISGWKSFDVPKSWEGSEDLAVVVVREIDGKNKLVIWGITGQGTWAACNYISDPSFRSNIDSDTAIIYWKDMDADGVVSYSDIVELYDSKSTIASSTNFLTKNTIYESSGYVSATDGNYYVVGAEAKGIDTIGAYDIARLDSGCPTVNLDTDVLNEQDIPDNVISIGGPAANKFTNEKGNKVKMSKSGPWYQVTIDGWREYTVSGDDCAVIYSQNNGGKSPIFIWGWAAKGTRAGCKYYANKLNNQDLGNAVLIIKWVDIDFDGDIDDNEIFLSDTSGTLPPTPLMINEYITVYHDVVKELLKTPKGAHAIKLCNLNFNHWSKDFTNHAEMLIKSLADNDKSKIEAIKNVVSACYEKLKIGSNCLYMQSHIIETTPKSDIIKHYRDTFNEKYYDPYHTPIKNIGVYDGYRCYLFNFEDQIYNAEKIRNRANEKKYECAQFFAKDILLPYTNEMIETAKTEQEKEYLRKVYDLIKIFNDSKSIKDENGVIISLESPALLHAYDQYGRHVGVNFTDNSTIDYEIIEAYYSGPDSHPQTIIIYNDSLDVRLFVDATGDGAFNLTVTNKNDTDRVISEYIDIPITSDSNAILNVYSKYKDDTLYLDSAGDNFYESEISPDSVTVQEAVPPFLDNISYQFQIEPDENVDIEVSIGDESMVENADILMFYPSGHSEEMSMNYVSRSAETGYNISRFTYTFLNTSEIGSYEFYILSEDIHGNSRSFGAYSFANSLGSIQLHTGWNLISTPLIPEDTGTASVLSPIGGNYDIVWEYNASDTTDHWKKYDPSAPFGNDLTDIEPGKGYWILMTSDDTLPITGTVPESTDINLKTGWNLIGYNSLDSQPITGALSSISGNYDIVWEYDASDATDHWKKYDPSAPFGNDLTDMEPGKGYWMMMNSDDTLEI